jgi:hypothetical protein
MTRLHLKAYVAWNLGQIEDTRQAMGVFTGDKGSGGRTGQSPWRGVIVFALGVTGLSSSEVWLLARLPNSTGADYASLVSGPTLALGQGMRLTSAKFSMSDGLINARSEDEKGAPGSAQQQGGPGVTEMPCLSKRYEITEIAQVHLQLSSMTIDTIISNDYTNKGHRMCNRALK